MTSSDDDSDDELPVKSIPGYHYDKKKKKYFKIQSTAFNDERSLTKDCIARKTTRKKIRKIKRTFDVNNIGRLKANEYCIPQLHRKSQMLGGTFDTQDKLNKLKLLTWTAKSLAPGTIPFFDAWHSTSMLTDEGVFVLRQKRSLNKASFRKLNLSVPGNETITDMRIRKPHYHVYNKSLDSYMAQVCARTFVIAASYSQVDKVVTILELYEDKQGSSYEMSAKVDVYGNLCDIACPAGANNVSVVVAFYHPSPSVKSIDMSCSTPTVSRTLVGFKQPKLASHFSNSNILFAGSKEGEVAVVDLRDKRSFNRLYRFRGTSDRYIHSMISLSDEVSLVTSHINGMKCLLDTRMNNIRRCNEEMRSETICDTSILKSEQTRKYITSSAHKSGLVRIWDARNLETIQMIKLPDISRRYNHCELTTNYGLLNLLTVDSESFTLYS